MKGTPQQGCMQPLLAGSKEPVTSVHAELNSASNVSELVLLVLSLEPSVRKRDSWL